MSENNIIITVPGEADAFAGMLIDLDLAQELSQAAHDTARAQCTPFRVFLTHAAVSAYHSYRES
jgi:Fungal protein kinase